MGNCLCRYACPRFRERRLWVCCAQLAGKLKESNLRALVYCEEESKESFLESSDGEEGRSSFNSQVSRSFNILDMGLGETRDKIDGLIDADLFALEGIAKAFDFPFWIGDSVCECQKHLIKEGRSGLLISDVLSEEVDRLASERLKLSVSRPFLRIYTVTWNMNGKKAALQDLAKLIGSSEEDHKGHDLLVVGLQEVPSCDVESVIVGALGDDYSLMASATMMSLQLFVIGRKHWEGYFQDLRVDKVGSGGFGAVVRRQKGAVAVSFKFKEASFLFIASHLSPHESNVEERNSQFQRISRSLFARTSSPRLTSCLSMPVDDEPAGDGPESLNGTIIEDSDMVVWLGDLNYRIQDHRSLVDSLINQNLYKSLWHKDQLSREIQRGNVFKGFREGPLAFRPTYKYDVGTDNYDTSPKERVPSWTDRILYKVKEGKGGITLDVCDYDAIESIKSSDHRPVKAVFTLNPC